MKVKHGLIATYFKAGLLYFWDSARDAQPLNVGVVPLPVARVVVSVTQGQLKETPRNKLRLPPP